MPSRHITSKSINHKSEHSEQVLICQWMRARRIDFFAVPNSARRNPRQAAWLKAEGMTAGVPDIIVITPPPKHPDKHLAIEVKRSSGGVVAPSQKEMHAKMTNQNWLVMVSKGYTHCVEILESLGY